MGQRGPLEGLELAGRHPVGRVVADHLRQVAARALDDALVDEAHHRALADVGAVGHDEPVGAHLADDGDQGAGYLHVARLVGHERRLVEQVEAQARARHVPVPLGEEAPVVPGGVQGELHGVRRASEELVRLELAAVDAVARDAVQAEVDVDAVAPAHLDGVVDRRERAGVDPHPVLRVGPSPVRERKAGEVESPRGHPLEVGLAERQDAPAARPAGKVEPAPARDARLGPRGGPLPAARPPSWPPRRRP